MELAENKCYRVIRKDDELLEQFPEFVVGAEFKAKQVVADGIVAVQFRNGPFVSIKDNPDSWFWCFYCSDTPEPEQMELEEIEELSSGQIEDNKQLGYLNGVPVTELLRKRIAASIEECVVDREIYAYIKYLEKALEFNGRGF